MNRTDALWVGLKLLGLYLLAGGLSDAIAGGCFLAGADESDRRIFRGVWVREFAGGVVRTVFGLALLLTPYVRGEGESSPAEG
jgi:hypothetical protein